MDQRAQVLALRGLLANHLLQHALQKRHLVDHGVNRWGGGPAGGIFWWPAFGRHGAVCVGSAGFVGPPRTLAPGWAHEALPVPTSPSLPPLSCTRACRSPSAPKRLSVPFRAAHTPAERSEFAQPDVALQLTTLSYYYGGLLFEEFETAVRTLIKKAPNAQAWHYGEWLELSRPEIPSGVQGYSRPAVLPGLAWLVVPFKTGYGAFDQVAMRESIVGQLWCCTHSALLHPHGPQT